MVTTIAVVHANNNKDEYLCTLLICSKLTKSANCLVYSCLPAVCA